MCLQVSPIKALLVFTKDDAQSDALKWAAEKLSCECTMAYTADSAVEMYRNTHPHLVFIDSRQSKSLDSKALSRLMHNIPGSQFVSFIAIVKKNSIDKEDRSLISYLQAGFTRWFLETSNLGCCLNELILIYHTDLSSHLKLRAAQSLFTALDNCKEGIIVTNVDHDIQYANKASERLLGYTTIDLCGKNAQTLCRAESVKADIVESINMQVKKGKEWEGTLFHKRKSGDNLPLWSRIQPVEISTGKTEYLVHVNECPFNEKPFSTDTADLLPLVRGARKGSVDVSLNRRQSFAKFHPLTIEPPITKVINMILATQEHSPMFVVQALDRVLDILRTTDIYSPQFTQMRQNTGGDTVASDLFSGLIANNKHVIRRFSHENFKNVPTTNMQPPLTPSSLPSLDNAPQKVKDLLEHVMSWDFDIIALEKVTEKRPLVWTGLSIFSKYNACNILGCDEAVLRNWLQLMESNYHSNPYHNSTHAADVLQATSYFLQTPRIKELFDPIEEIISLIAAVVHDVDHPGRNSAFMCNSGNELAILYNDLSVLENHHAALAFKLTMQNDKVNIFQNLSKDSFKEVRRSVIDMVLATEMTKHFEHLTKFVNVFNVSVEAEEDEAPDTQSSSVTAIITPKTLDLVKRILIKCADICNPVRPLYLYKDWAMRIAEEYMSQTDEEKNKGYPVVMPAFDRATCSIPQSQIGFINMFVHDLFENWDAFCNIPELIHNIKQNVEYWKQEALKEKGECSSSSSS